MVYANACYAPGASEPGEPAATATRCALQRAANFSRPVLAGLGASAYFATDIGAAPLVAVDPVKPDSRLRAICTTRTSRGAMTVTKQSHPLVSGDALWLGLGSSAGVVQVRLRRRPDGHLRGGTGDGTDSTPSGLTTYDPPRTLNFDAGTYTGYAFDASGKVTGSKTCTLSRSSTASTSQRSTAIPGHAGTWFYVINGVWAGYWVQGGSHVYVTEPTPTTTSPSVTSYNPARSLVFASGSHTGYRFDASGAVTASQDLTLSRASGAATSQRSTAIPGHRGAWFYVVNGIWAGYWLPESTRLYLRGISQETDFGSPHTVSFAAGTYTGLPLQLELERGRHQAVVPHAHTSAASGAKVAIINGRSYVYIINGVWADYWVPTGGGVTVR